MRALVLRQHGDLDQLRLEPDYPRPSAAEGQVVIRVRASSFNYHDVFTVKGMPGIKVPMPVVIGLDMAGTVAEAGAGVVGGGPGGRGGDIPINRKGGLVGGGGGGGLAGRWLAAGGQRTRP